MARVTVEDCLRKIPNRFELVVIATKRARQLSIGNAEALVPLENDKPTVLALREIAAGLVDESILHETTAIEQAEDSFFNEEEMTAAAESTIAAQSSDEVAAPTDSPADKQA